MNVKTENEVIIKGKLAKLASQVLLKKTTEEKNEALLAIAKQLHESRQQILESNALDIENGKQANLLPNVLDRILLTDVRIDAMIEAIHQLIQLQDPIGEILEETLKENGLHIYKKRVPLGVIGMIYEARPNVTIDAATLALKTNNAVILRGSSSAIHSNKALVEAMHTALLKVDFPVESILLIEDTSRETAQALFTMNEYLDVLIPRGGKALIDLVVEQSTVPVLETGAGNCHIYFDASANYEIAEKVILNAKLQRPSVCNACESIVMHEDFAKLHGANLLHTLSEHGVTLYGDELAQSLHPAVLQATEAHYATEFLDLVLSVKTVSSIDDAITHINTYSTNHSEAIITEEAANAEKFLHEIDAAAVYHNASTRFTDGFEFGYGAEIGISTQKLHARGPMGLPALTSTKFIIKGSGQIRA